MKKYQGVLFVTGITFLAAFSRFYGNGFDNGLFMHPDERAVMFAAERVHFFSNFNPDFFSYGTLPIYILKGIAQAVDPLFRAPMTQFGELTKLGRVIASLVDMGTLWLVFLIARRIFVDRMVAFYSALFYLLSFFPLQNSNFFVVDNFVNFFLSLLFYFLIRYLEKPKWGTVIGVAAATAAVLASKVTPVIFLPVILVIFFLNFSGDRIRLTASWGRSLLAAGLFLLLFFCFHFLFMPYAYLAFPRFLSEVTAQIRMNNDPYVFPYTLQYVGTLPYLYYLKNILLWGVGPVVSLFLIIGVGYLAGDLYQGVKRRKTIVWLFFIYFLFNLYYLGVIGRSAVKFMRYMLPLYPFFAVMAGYGLNRLAQSLPVSPRWKKGCVILIFILAALWLSAFMNIYSSPHTRKQASLWMAANIPSGAVLATEHWDERLPCYGGGNFKYVELNMYDLPDDDRKWAAMNEKLDQADYIVIASQKLYVPLQRLADCQKFKSCYPRAKKYYEDLFAGRLGFKKVAQFTSYPRFPFLPKRFEIVDDSADESFSVYDHPRVYLFRKTLSPHLTWLEQCREGQAHP